MASKVYTVGTYLAERLHNVLHLKHVFCVPGDFTMSLLDEVSKPGTLQLVSCCNELNAGYAADGYARAVGASALVLTYNVGSLSALNAIAGSYAEDIPVLLISGGLNSNDFAYSSRMHHSHGGQGEGSEPLRMFQNVTAAAVVIRHPNEAPALIDQAINAAMIKHKPVYIEIACNIADLPVCAPAPMSGPSLISDIAGLQWVTSEINALWDQAEHPILIAGSKLRSFQAAKIFRDLVDALCCPVAVLPNARSLFPESHPSFIGVYWGPASSKGCQEQVEKSDLVIYCGADLNDYLTAGFTTVLDRNRVASILPSRTILPQGESVGVYMSTVLASLADRLARKEDLAKQPRWAAVKEDSPQSRRIQYSPDDSLQADVLIEHINALLTSNSSLIVETGTAWFHALGLRLPDGTALELQAQYASIGWALPCVLGTALASSAITEGARVIGIIGDGALQAVVQELSTLLRYHLNPILFILNNREYVIESVLHGPGKDYNKLQNWDYAGLLRIFDVNDSRGLGIKVNTQLELEDAINKAKEFPGLVLIECTIDPSDYSPLLAAFGKRVQAVHTRPHRPYGISDTTFTLPLDLV